MDKEELELLKDIPVLDGELEWVMKVIDELQSKESVLGVVREFPCNNDSTK